MSLYYLQKLLYEMNRCPEMREPILSGSALPNGYDLSDDERAAVLNRDIGFLYIIGVNGQILMTFAAASGIGWNDYLEAMRNGVRKHGPVRAGIYAMTTGPDKRPPGL